MDTRGHFITLARYHVWATQRLLDAVAALDDAAYGRDVGLFFKSVRGTLNHLVVAESLVWQRRFEAGESPRVALDQDLMLDRLQLAQTLIQGARAWEGLIRDWPIERFDGEIAYTTMRGSDVSLPFDLTLAHVFNHATHHRGQITAALTVMGQPAPVLDLVYFLQA